MKKSQALAALALAFALGLGVVAPVANTVISGTTYAAETRAVESATEAQVADAIAKIEAYDTYKRFAAVIDAVDYYKTEKVISNGRTISEVTNETGLITAINTAIKTVTGETKNYSTLNTALTKAQEVAKYTEYNNLYTLLEEKDANINATTLLSDIRAIDNSDDTNEALEDIDTNSVADLRNFVNNTWALKDTYVKYAALIAAVNDGTEYNNFRTTMVNALNNVQTWKGDDEDAVVDAAAYDAAKNANPVDSLIALVYDTNTSKYVDTAVKGTTQYAALYDAVEAASTALEDGDYKGESLANQGVIDNLNTLLEDASDVVPGEKVSLDDLSAPTSDPTTPTNATITSADGAVSVTGKLDATKVTLISTKSDKKVSAFGDAKYAMWDIALVDENGAPAKFEGSLMVKIKLPEGFNGKRSSVYHVSDDLKTTNKVAATTENGYMVFTVDHFSLYAIVEDGGIEAPITGVLAGAEGNASTTVAMVAGVATALTAAGAGVVAYRNARRSTRK